MFEKFSSLSRDVAHRAQGEAERRGSLDVRTEHLLLALLETSGGHHGRILNQLGLDWDKIGAELRAIMVKPDGERKTRPGDIHPIPFNAHTKAVIGCAIGEAARTGGNWKVETEHLLFAFFLSSSLAGEVLRGHGITAVKIRPLLSRPVSSKH